MIGNIIDRRTNACNVDVDVIFEPSCHDNNCKGATKFESKFVRQHHDYFSEEELYDTTIEKACHWARMKTMPVTIHLYDAGSRPGDVKKD